MAEFRESNDAQSSGIKSVDVAFRVLVALEQGRGPLGLSQLARLADLHPAKAHRYLTSLIRTGLASQDSATGLYDLGPAARELGVEALRRLDPVRTATGFALDLRDRTGHTVNMSVWGDSGPTIVAWDTGTHPLPIAIRVGSTLPMLDSAVGHVFLGHLPKSVTDPVIKAQQRQGATTRMSAAEVEALRKESREAPFTGVERQMIVGLAALAAPVFGPSGSLELVLGIVLPERLAGKSRSRALGKQLSETAQLVSADLGSAGA